MTYLEYLLLVRKLFLNSDTGLGYANCSAVRQAPRKDHYIKFQSYIIQQCKGNVWVTSNLPLNETQTASEYKERCKAFRLFLIDYAIGMEKQNEQIRR